MCFTAELRALSCLTNQNREPFPGIPAVSFLTSKPPGIKDDHPALGDPPACQPDEPGAHLLGQGCRVSYVEAELHCGGYLVYILATWSRTVDKLLLDFALIDFNRWCDPDHGAPYGPYLYPWKANERLLFGASLIRFVLMLFCSKHYVPNHMESPLIYDDLLRYGMSLLANTWFVPEQTLFSS